MNAKQIQRVGPQHLQEQNENTLISMKTLAHKVYGELKKYAPEMQEIRSITKIADGETSEDTFGRMRKRSQFFAELNASLPPETQITQPLSMPDMSLINECDDVEYMEELLITLWRLLRVAKLKHDPTDDLTSSNHEELAIKLDSDMIEGLSPGQLNKILEDASIAMRTIGFADVSMPGGNVKLTKEKITDGLAIPFIEGFADEQRQAITARMKMIS